MDDNFTHMVRTQHLAVVHAACLVVVLIAHKRFINRNRVNVPTRALMLHRQEILCQKLQSEGGLRPTQRMTIEEQVARGDGTHVRVRVPINDAPRYHGHKGYPTINVLAACTFDLKFTYVLSGWEGTASYSRIIKDALTREDKLIIPNGKFYLVDGGLPHRSTLIAPYRGVRYHLKEYSNRAPQNPRELFNLCRASLRNSIERAFGILKKRFPIEDRDKELEDEVMHEVLNAIQDEEVHAPRDANNRGEQIRDSMANEMWNEYLLYPNNEINMSI
ncbi:putative nuclease HARBI1 [Tanacetum coccineum]